MKIGDITVKDLGDFCGSECGDYKPDYCKTNQCKSCGNKEFRRTFLYRIFNKKEISYLSKDGKFIIPAIQYSLFNKVFFSHKYNKIFSNWLVYFKSKYKKHPINTKIYYKESDMINKYGTKWQIPTNKDWVIQ